GSSRYVETEEPARTGAAEQGEPVPPEHAPVEDRGPACSRGGRGEGPQPLPVASVERGHRALVGADERDARYGAHRREDLSRKWFRGPLDLAGRRIEREHLRDVGRRVRVGVAD